MIVKLAENEIDKEHVFEIRRLVFVNEQKVPLEEEIDAYDKSETVLHLLGIHNEKPVAASRIRFEEDYAKLERIAVLKEARGKNYGAKMVRAMEDVILTHKYKKVVLNSQEYAIDFYKKLGYKTNSKVCMDADIPHVTMIKNI